MRCLDEKNDLKGFKMINEENMLNASELFNIASRRSKLETGEKFFFEEIEDDGDAEAAIDDAFRYYNDPGEKRAYLKKMLAEMPSKDVKIALGYIYKCQLWMC
jgi:hypothetical protein